MTLLYLWCSRSGRSRTGNKEGAPLPSCSKRSVRQVPMGSNWECPPTNRPIHNGLSTIDRPAVRATTTTSLVSTTQSSPSSCLHARRRGRGKGLGRFGGGGLTRGGLSHDVDEVVEELACSQHKRTQGGEAWIHTSQCSGAPARAHTLGWLCGVPTVRVWSSQLYSGLTSTRLRKWGCPNVI